MITVDPRSMFLWGNRLVYLGVMATVLWWSRSFWGTFNLLFPVDPRLLPLAALGLACHEAGVWAARVRRRSNPLRTAHTSRRRDSLDGLGATAIFVLAALLSAYLFSRDGVPLWTDPMARANMGQGAGLAKRGLHVWLPMASVHLMLISRRQTAWRWFAFATAGITGTMLFLLLAKSKLLFLSYFTGLALMLPREGDPRGISLRLLVRGGVLFIVVLSIFVKLYSQYGGVSAQGGLRTVMMVRSTVLITQSPNFILYGVGDIPTSSEVLLNDLAGVGSTLRVPGSPRPRQIDTELTHQITGNRALRSGGLNPTVLGYGWMIGGWLAVAILSLVYGWVGEYFRRRIDLSAGVLSTLTAMFGTFAVFQAVQIFSPIGTLLDSGLSIVGYVLFIYAFRIFVRPVARRSPTVAMWLPS